MAWDVKKLKDVCNKGSSNVSLNKLDSEEGDYPIYGAKGLIKNVSFYHQDKEYISIIKDGAGIGRIELREPKSSVIGTLQYLIPTSEIDIRYLYYFLLGIDFSKYSQGAAIPHIYFKDYAEEEILIPPIEIQKKIVEVLDSAFEKIAKAKENSEQNLQNAKDVFESYLQKVFENKGENWEEKEIKDLSKNKDAIVSGPFGSNLKVEHYKESGIPIVRLQNVGKGFFIEKDIKYITEEKAEELKYHSFKSGDLILAKLGIPVGKTCKVPNTFPKGIIVADVVRIRLDPNIINYDFLLFYLNTDLAVSQLTKNISGATRPRVNLSDVREIKMFFPKSLEEQKAIVSKLDELSEQTKQLESIYSRKLDCLEELKQSILQKAFKGELTEVLS